MTTGEGEREFLERSLADLDREHDAGDLSDADHAALRARYERRLRAPGPEPLPPRRPGLVIASVSLLVVVAVAAGVLVARFAGRRDPGEALSGGGPQPAATAPASTVPDDLARCLSLESSREGREILDCYQELLDRRPDDPGALTYFGWFLFREGSAAQQVELVDTALRLLDRAVAADPAFPDARALRAVVFARLGRVDAALAELDVLDTLGADPSLLRFVEGLREDLEAASTTTTAAPATTSVP